MKKADQNIRMAVAGAGFNELSSSRAQLDAHHAKRMREIICEGGWPLRSQVGDEAASAAWLLVQHSDAALIRECLPLMQRAVLSGEASATDLAFLVDRLRVFDGLPQLYGTQYVLIQGRWQLHPVEAVMLLDERRRSVGLGPFSDQSGPPPNPSQ